MMFLLQNMENQNISLSMKYRISLNEKGLSEQSLLSEHKKLSSHDQMLIFFPQNLLHILQADTSHLKCFHWIIKNTFFLQNKTIRERHLLIIQDDEVCQN